MSTPTSNQLYEGLPPQVRSLLELFGNADACWFSSVRADGRTHLAPIWHVLHEGHIYVVTQRRSVRSANVRANPSVSLALADTSNPVIIEGSASVAEEMRSALREAFLAKYNWDITTDASYDDILRVTPRKLLAWGSHGEGRWTLDSA